MGLFNVSPEDIASGRCVIAFITYTVVKAMSDLGVAKAGDYHCYQPDCGCLHY